VRIVHNVQQAEIVEDMGKNVPKIYEALDNKQEKYQPQMIEVEGMINNQTISILIDSGAIHSNIDPKMVESLHFPRSKHGKSWLVSWLPVDSQFTFFHCLISYLHQFLQTLFFRCNSLINDTFIFAPFAHLPSFLFSQL
jgi:hypothetical protein